MALNKTTQAALVTELREWHQETNSEFDSRWGADITLYRAPISTPLEEILLSAVFTIDEDEHPEVLSRTLLQKGQYELLIFGSHSKLDTAGVWTEFTGE
tara:strand:- start:1686 stop:1982 length:297 start_codon:yes stop_codon:yes gene_type:complete